MNSSQKKNSITSLDEYDRLSQLYNDAWDRSLLPRFMPGKKFKKSLEDTKFEKA
jgi:hypothetical protein